MDSRSPRSYVRPENPRALRTLSICSSHLSYPSVLRSCGSALRRVIHQSCHTHWRLVLERSFASHQAISCLSCSSTDTIESDSRRRFLWGLRWREPSLGLSQAWHSRMTITIIMITATMITATMITATTATTATITPSRASPKLNRHAHPTTIMTTERSLLTLL